MLKKIKFKGGFFNEEKELKLFINEDRISLLYGKMVLERVQFPTLCVRQKGT